MRRAKTNNDRAKDLGELTVDDRLFDGRIKYDPISCFYAHTSKGTRGWFVAGMLTQRAARTPWPHECIGFLPTSCRISIGSSGSYLPSAPGG
jgi:hypothetical protein